MPKNEFEGLEGRPPEPFDRPQKKHDHLDEVRSESKPSWHYNISDYWNMFLAIFRDYALSKLDVTSQAKVLSIRSYIVIVSVLLNIGLIVWLTWFR